MTPVAYTLITFLMVACLSVTPCMAQTAVANQISQYGITWTFDKDYRVGQFANGDHWVVGPVTIVCISPASIVTAGRTINGSMLDPVSGQGFDSGASAITRLLM